MGDQPDLLQHILDELASIKATVTSVRDDVIALKANGENVKALTADVKDHSARLQKLEIAAAAWTAGATVSGAVGKWVAGIVAGVIVSGGVAALAWVFGHR